MTVSTNAIRRLLLSLLFVAPACAIISGASFWMALASFAIACIGIT